MSFDYTLEIIDQSSIEQAAELVVSTFHAREPLANMNSADPAEFNGFIHHLTEQCAEQKLGFVVKETESERVIGVVLAADLAPSVNVSGDEPEIQSNPIASIITALNKLHFKDQVMPANEYLNIKFVAMDSNFKGKGVVNELLEFCMTEAKAKGFKFAQAEATGNISQHIFKNKLGFEEKAFINYSDFEFGGEKLFSSIVDHKGLMLLVKPL